MYRNAPSGRGGVRSTAVTAAELENHATQEQVLINATPDQIKALRAFGINVEAVEDQDPVTLPTVLKERLVYSPVVPQRVPLSFWDYLTTKECPWPRPFRRGLSGKTPTNYMRVLRQICRETQHDHIEDGPDWRKILDWRNAHHKGAVSLETHQKGLVWLAWYYGQGGGNMPFFLTQTWSSDVELEVAQMAGRAKKYNDHLELPTDIQTLLASHPFEDRLRLERGWSNEKMRFAALYRDKLWRHMIHLGTSTGPRGSSEFATLRLPMVQPEKSRIMKWPQPKKRGKPRNVVLPDQDYLWTSRVDPSCRWYLDNVRPLVANEESGDAYLLTSEGKPLSPNYARDLIREGIDLVLGRPYGPHTLRRAWNNWAAFHGWSRKQRALLLDDDEDVVEDTYDDTDWLQAMAPLQKKHRSERPPLPAIRSNGKRTLNLETVEKYRRLKGVRPKKVDREAQKARAIFGHDAVKTSLLPEFSSELGSAPAGI